ncbi:ATP12 family chaperone protein [Pedomonas mirosovicensis]|uniref:ATP12 family chaperone protein n=1 Tax=Pedomonas mirosovicensis TaxID=2908641 RepID=UPI002168A3AB|nr:ATP12 family protein [Pedomonas mirosovicensis]MCH8685994.1 ATPase [Pedomonas mirosovicensis]
MKRFYKQVSIAPTEGGYQIHLDGRPVRTPSKAVLVVPGKALAEAVAQEWDAQVETIEPAAMPLTRHANTVLDRVALHRDAVVEEIARYGETDLICYRAEWPTELAERQCRTWDPLVDWARRRYDVSLTTVSGIMHQPQGDETLERLTRSVESLSDWQLAPLHTLTTITGSLVIGLALLEGEVSPEQAWEAGQLDELFQAEKWGEDELAVKAHEARRVDLLSAARFLELLRAG